MLVRVVPFRSAGCCHCAICCVADSCSFSVLIKSKAMPRCQDGSSVRIRRMLHAARLTVPARLLRNNRICSCAGRIQAMSQQGSAGNGSDGPHTRMQKTNAKEFYCLTEKDVWHLRVMCAHVTCGVSVIAKQKLCLHVQLEPLAFEEKANRRYKNATPTKLYKTAEVSKLISFSLH